MRRSITIKLTAIVTAIAVLLACAGGLALTWSFNEPASTEIAASQFTDDGVIKVYLKSLGAPEALTITLAGAYTMENDKGFRFDRDTRIILSVNGDSITLTAGGLNIDMGGSLTLTRHAVNDGDNGLYIYESERNKLYCGDLNVSVENGALKAVLSIHMEDYLYGVVAYEMSDSFPLEALKAQAVAARTYAMSRKWSRGSKSYDLVDTTADQVYKGFDAGFTNIIQAVDETRGVVLTYNGGFATCYYTASNGGQTALATDIWGGSGDYGYLDMRDDPYDIENPSSLVNSLYISPKCSESPKLLSMLLSGLQKAVDATNLNYGELRFDAITDITPSAPKFEGSHMYTSLDFSISASARLYEPVPTPEATPVPTATATIYPGTPTDMPTLEPVTPVEYVLGDWRKLPDAYIISLSVYDDIKDTLALGLNGSDYEVISVSKQGESGAYTAFTIQMRRFGHGVGMSQRGAQWMASQYGMKYTDILGFYYPNAKLERMDLPEVTLSALGELPASIGRARANPTPTPTPAPLPALQSGEYYASVELSSKASTLNMREEPSTSGRVLATLSYGQRVIVRSDVDANGWVAVKTAEYEGYVMLEYLKPD